MTRRSTARGGPVERALVAAALAVLGCAATEAAPRSDREEARREVASAARTDAAAEEAAVLHALNQARAKRRLPPLTLCRSLARAAREHSAEMRDRDRVGHDSRTGTSLLDRACGAGFGRACRSGESVAETVAAGQPDATRVLAAWLASPGHRRIVLDPDLTLAGAGYAGGGRLERYWTVIYARGTDPSCGERPPGRRASSGR